MCGIAGIWNFSGRSDETDMADVRSMIAVTAHRGPDGQGYRAVDSLALGHCRLSIIDLTDRGSQPMQSSDGRGLLSYNGEIYNFRELRKELTEQGAVFSGDCDTEVVLNALRIWGVERAVSRFNGMFAFAYYDMQERVLWLVRDRIGVKSLSVAQYENRLIFCSEDKGILALDSFPTQISAREITLRLAAQASDGGSSLFRRIRRLPPGGCWKISAKGVEENRFWDALESVDPDRLEAGSRIKDGLVRHLDDLLQNSVAMHCISDAPLATACSGGIDSGLVTAMSKTVMQDYHGYVMDPDVGVNEVEAAQRTGRKCGVEIRRVAENRDKYLRNLPKSIYHVENDTHLVSTPSLLAMTEQCRADGVKVLLTGEGADELFGGYNWHRNSARLWRKLDPPRSLLLRDSQRKKLLKQLRESPFTTSLRMGIQETRNSVISALSPQRFMLQEKILERLAPVRNHQARVFAARGLFDIYSHLQSLLHRHDRISMASSVELRVPFIENDIIDFALHLHPDFKYRKRTSKWLLRTVARNYLPEENIRAPKIGFAITTSYTRGCEAMLSNGFLRDVMRWSRAETDQVTRLASLDVNSHIRLIGMEILVRLYCAGETADAISEKLIGMQRDASQ
ncbi:MAG: asparagine synthetase B [Rhizobiaceae bacterium MnEN-MB40S]|nr:MAG: asparagine synthetase B [Rhizobiaceae bacterium MnEN-MB40S]